MNIEIDKIRLIDQIVDEKDGTTKLLKSVQNIRIREKRRIVEKKIPDQEGSSITDIGREPIRMCFEGTIYGKEARDELEKLRYKYKQGEALDFLSDLSGVVEITKILIYDLHVEDASDSVNNFRYFMRIKEYTPFKKNENLSSNQEQDAKKETEKKSNESSSSENMIKGKVLDAEKKPKTGIPVRVIGDKCEFRLITDNNGVYKQEKVEKGKYTVIIDSPEYKLFKKTFEIK